MITYEDLMEHQEMASRLAEIIQQGGPEGAEVVREVAQKLYEESYGQKPPVPYQDLPKGEQKDWIEMALSGGPIIVRGTER